MSCKLLKEWASTPMGRGCWGGGGGGGGANRNPIIPLFTQLRWSERCFISKNWHIRSVWISASSFSFHFFYEKDVVFFSTFYINNHVDDTVVDWNMFGKEDSVTASKGSRLWIIMAFKQREMQVLVYSLVRWFLASNPAPPGSLSYWVATFPGDLVR